MPENTPETPRIEQEKHQLDHAIRSTETEIRQAPDQQRYQVLQHDLTRAGYDSEGLDGESFGYGIG
jgi:hypothetical protein